VSMSVAGQGVGVGKGKRPAGRVVRGQVRVCSGTSFSKRVGQERTGRDRKGEMCLG